VLASLAIDAPACYLKLHTLVFFHAAQQLRLLSVPGPSYRGIAFGAGAGREDRPGRGDGAPVGAAGHPPGAEAGAGDRVGAAAADRRAGARANHKNLGFRSESTWHHRQRFGAAAADRGAGGSAEF